MWFGLNDIEHEGTFTWEADNSIVNFTNWVPGEPNNWKKTQDCVAVGAKTSLGLWNDDPCVSTRRYICEKPANGMFNMLNCYE